MAGPLQNPFMFKSAAGATGFYSHQIASSLRNSNAQDGTLKFTAGTPTSSTTFTMSYWVKKYTNSTDGNDNNIFVAGTGGSASLNHAFATGPEFWSLGQGGNWGSGYLVSNAKIRDTSAWYHSVWRYDSTQGTAADRVRLYVNGEQVTSWRVSSMHSNVAEDEAFSYINESGVVQSFGGISGVGPFPVDGADLQMAEIVFNDGQSYGPDSYGETKNGVWIPKNPSGLTFGDNGYWLKMASGAIGTDSSGNGNNFTVANIAAHDVMLDSPTFNSDSNGGNFCTGNPLLLNPNTVWSEGNLKITTSANNMGTMCNWQVPLTGKWYWEVLYDDQYSSGTAAWVGVAPADTDLTDDPEDDAKGLQYYSYDGKKVFEGTLSAYGATWAEDDIISVAVDRDADTIQFYKNGAGQGTIDISGLADDEFFPYFGVTGVAGQQGAFFNFGQEGTFGGAITAGGNADVTGYGNFKYDPGDFKALCAGNLPTADAVDPAQTSDDYPQKLYNSVLYTGNGASDKAVTGVGFQPDWLWGKVRSAVNDSWIYDSTRGDFRLVTDSTAAQVDYSAEFAQFDSDGWTYGTNANSQNADEATFIGRSLRANGGTTSSNGNGDLTSTVQADPSGCFSIVTYTGTLSGAGVETVGHGLSSAPSYIITKLIASGNWWVLSDGQASWNYAMNLSGAAASVDKSGNGSMSAPTPTVFSTNNTEGLNDSGGNIAYCFANCEGYIKSGSYEGNGNANGSFVYCGFRPALIMTKSIDSTSDWQMFDDTRVGYNVDNNELKANSTAAETTTDMIDILSNGFKMRIATDPNVAETYVYLAIAHNPFQYATAR
jgi:hypothetical protein